MTVKRNKKGVLYWTTYIDGKRVKRESRFWKTQKEAKEHYEEFVEKLGKGEEILNRVNYEQLLSLYIDHISLSRKQSTVKGLENQLRNVLGRHFEGVAIDKIDADMIREVQKRLLAHTYVSKGMDRHYSNAHLYKLQTSLKNMLDFAFKFRYINQNPFDLVPIVQRRVYEEKKQMTILTKQQFEDFISTVDDQVLKTMFVILYWTGARIGEVMALRISDYNRDKQLLHIYKTYDSKNQLITTTKTDSDRFVSIPGICSKEIETLIDAYKSEAGSLFDASSFLFAYDGIIPKTTLDTRKNDLIKKAQIEHKKNVPYFTFHELRHTHVSTLIDLDLKPKDIADRLGHSVEQVNNTYSHLFPERKDLLLSKLDEFSKK